MNDYENRIDPSLFPEDFDQNVKNIVDKLFSAINKVELEYIRFDGYGDSVNDYINSVKDNDNHVEKENAVSHVERVFAYELYHQLRCQDIGLMINAEIPKLKPDNKYSYPDLVIHTSQARKDDQLLICEIKRAEGCKGLSDDLKKLDGFLEYLEYKIGVMIYYNGIYDDICSQISDSYKRSILLIVVGPDRKISYKFV